MRSRFVQIVTRALFALWVVGLVACGSGTTTVADSSIGDTGSADTTNGADIQHSDTPEDNSGDLELDGNDTKTGTDALCSFPTDLGLPSSIPTTPGSHNLMLSHNGSERLYRVQIPTSYDGNVALPLVFVLHGSGETVTSHLQGNPEWIAAGEQAKMILVFPLAFKQTWNAIACCGGAVACGIDDIGFIKALATTVQGGLKVDSKRVYITGFSNGGMMVHRIVEGLPELFTAAASMAGPAGGVADTSVSSVVTQIGAVKPLPILIIHGAADVTVPFSGGANLENPNRLFLSHEATVKLWVANNSCGVTPESKSIDTSVGKVVLDRYTGCTNGATVVSMVVGKLIHRIPSPKYSGGYDGIKATFEFFASFSKP